MSERKQDQSIEETFAQLDELLAALDAAEA